ncbi:MAG: RrF2 family transcriptional regulator [Tepidisphaerales bacterium]
MLALPKKTDYALIALYYLLERPDRVAPAREIAEAYHLPCALLMNVMKELHQGGLVRSVRGARGGYQVAPALREATLYDVVVLTSGVEPALTECCQELVPHEPSSEAPASGLRCQVGHTCPVRQPLRALHHRLVRFLKDVKVVDLLVPGVRIDVPLEAVGVAAGGNEGEGE